MCYIVLCLIGVSLCAGKALVELDDANFNPTVDIVKNKNHGDWFVLIYSEDELSQNLLK